MALCIRELSHKYGSFEIQNFRNLFSIIILLIIFFINKNSKLNSEQLSINFIRNIFHFIGQSCWTWGLTITFSACVFNRIYYASMGFYYSYTIFKRENNF